jgi:hypothetical protein
MKDYTADPRNVKTDSRLGRKKQDIPIYQHTGEIQSVWVPLIIEVRTDVEVGHEEWWIYEYGASVGSGEVLKHDLAAGEELVNIARELAHKRNYVRGAYRAAATRATEPV